MLFIPGSGGGREEWVCQTGYFTSSEGVALPGHPEGEPCPSVDDYVEWLWGYIYQHQYQDVILVGHSLGGAIVQLYGLKHPERVKALVLIGTGVRLRVLPSSITALGEMVTDETRWREYLEQRYRLVTPETRRIIIESKMRIGPAVMLSDFHCCDKFDIMDKVHTIKLPTLIIGGSDDEMTPVKYANYLADKIEGASKVIIEGGTHFVFAEQPDEVNQAIGKFLSSLS
ncbi:alpha/beta fold hydrolase [Chloroflexota bacterium]